MTDAFALNPAARVSLMRIGQEGQPVAVVDALLANPASLVDLAGDGSGFSPDPGNFYPGLRLALPQAYGAALADFVNAFLRDHFQIKVGLCCVPVMAALSIACTPPQVLAPIQSIPHFDTSAAEQLAAVHYLCAPDHGGTAFYRHRASGFEAVTDDRSQAYGKALARQASSHGLPPPGYINGDSVLFAQTAKIDAAFNRAVFYPSNLLHAGCIDAAKGLSADPRSGRLTATSFLRIE